MTMTLIETKTLGTTASSISFTSIPQTYTDLVMLLSIRSDRNQSDDPLEADINGGSTAITRRELYGSGSSVNTSGTDTILFYTSAGLNTPNTFGNGVIYFPNYTGSTNKSISIDGVSENNNTTAYQAITSALWPSTAAITSISIKSRTVSNLVAGSTISLYGILKGSSGGVVVS